ncbi:MAG: DUF1697 domain-containing protein [Proteobacteria bacterium]|nr:DUF1697 domain-containing protein [Pseudomonadota bacterium]
MSAITMYTHVVLLRGVNVGKGNRIPMATFKSLLQRLGCEDVRTLLNSGNAVVSRPKVSAGTLAGEVGSAIHDTVGLDVQVVVKSSRDFGAIVASNQLLSSSTDPSRLLVSFAQSGPALKALASISSVVRAPDRFHLGAKAAYLYCPRGILVSEAAKALLGKAGRGVTTRNWATVLKIHGLLSAQMPE